jgi:hypothetical protein
MQGSTYRFPDTGSFEGNLKAAGQGNRDETVTVHSFEVELPVMFGRESASGITRDDRSLPSLRFQGGERQSPQEPVQVVPHQDHHRRPSHQRGERSRQTDARRQREVLESYSPISPSTTMRSGLTAERRRRSAGESSPTTYARSSACSVWPGRPRRSKEYSALLGDTVGSPCHARDALGLAET